MSDLNFLVVGAHPDDAELHLAGTLARATQRGLSCAILDLSQGEMSSRGTPALRAQEAAQAAGCLGVKRYNLNLPDTNILPTAEQLQSVIEFIRSHKPHICVLPSPTDPHPDHVSAHHLFKRASYLSGLSKVSGGDPFRPSALLWVGGENPTIPDLLVNISEQWSIKQQSLACYASQFDARFSVQQTRLTDPLYLKGMEGRSLHWGSLIGSDYAEALWSPKPVPPDVIEFLGRLV